MEQLKFGDRIHWRTVNDTSSGIIEKVIDETTLGCRMNDGGLMHVSVYSIIKLEHKEL